MEETYEVQRTIIRNDGKVKKTTLHYTEKPLQAQKYLKKEIDALRMFDGFKQEIYINMWTRIIIMNKGQIVFTIEKWNS